MNNLNSILIEGNLVRDPLYRSTPKGTPLCTFSLASNRFFKQDSGLEKEVGFFDVETWAKLADSCYNLGHKGRGVRVVGRLKQSRWNDPDGKPRSKVTIVAEHVEFRPDFKKDSEAGFEKPEAGAASSEPGLADTALAESTLAESALAEPSETAPGSGFPAPGFSQAAPVMEQDAEIPSFVEELEPVTF